MEALEKTLKKLLSGIITLPEKKMQLLLLEKRLATLKPSDVAHLLDMLYQHKGNAKAVRKLKDLLIDPQALESALGTEKFRLTYIASIELELEKVSRLFTDLPPHKLGLAGYNKEEEIKMEHTTLGQRRSLAKSSVKDTLDRLLSDPDVMVVDNLLNNPRMTEQEVLKIASKRPNSPNILKRLAMHRKWSKRYQVIKAIIRNPYTPPRISTGLLEFLMYQDITQIAKDNTLHPQVRMGAQDIIDEKSKGKESE